MKAYILAILMMPFLTGCFSLFDITPRVETVIDRVYVPQECPTFTYTLKINGSKFNPNSSYSETMIITTLDSFLESLERNKLARQTFNNGIKESNKVVRIPGVAQTSNIKRIEKRIFVKRECPKYTYKPQIKARKLTSKFIPDNNTTYVVFSLNNMVILMEKYKMSKEVFNNHIDVINKKPFTEEMNHKFYGYVEIAVSKIDDTADAIKVKAKDKAFDSAKESVQDD